MPFTCTELSILFGSQDGVASPEDIDTVLTDGLGLRYSILGPFEAIHLNANGVFSLYAFTGCVAMWMLFRALSCCGLILLWPYLAVALSCCGLILLCSSVCETGVGDYCERYGENISRVCEDQGGPRQMSGQALDTLKQRMEQKYPLDQLEERRRLRDKRLASLARHRCGEQKDK